MFNPKDINTQVVAFRETRLNVFLAYVPNKFITVDNRDHLWTKEITKSEIKEKKCTLQKIYLPMKGLKVNSMKIS